MRLPARAIAVLALALSACAGQAQPAGPPSAGPLPADVAKLLPRGAQVVGAEQAQMHAQGDTSWVVLYTMPNPPTAPSGSPRYNASISIVDKRPNGWSPSKTVSELGPVGAKLRMTSVDQLPTAAVSFGIGANSAGMWLLRAGGMSYAVIFYGTGDSVRLDDLNGNGTPEVLVSWSPFCQSHVASPRLTTVYAFKGEVYVADTSRFPKLIADDAANFRSALTRAANPTTKPAWTPTDKACLHGALAYLAGEAGDGIQAQAELSRAKQLDPGYDLASLQKLAR